ncbi:MAG: IPT/TIG domain-containing protein [Blastocatellia bacterium]|nr:IPT/TIG domain-containing protein [Blastocatellia bacterium]
MKYIHDLKAPIQNLRFTFWTRLTLLAVLAAGCIGMNYVANAASPAQSALGPSIGRFYPIATVPGRTIRITGNNFTASEKGGIVQVFFGGKNMIPAAGAQLVSSSTIEAIVPKSGELAQNINGYLTVRIGGRDYTTASLPQNVIDPSDESSVYPEFILMGDIDGNGLNAEKESKDVTLCRAIYLGQMKPTMRQFVAAKVFPANRNLSRGNGKPVSIDDFNAIREVSLGRASF